MNKTSALFVGTVAAGLLLTATPALAHERGSGDDGMHLGTFVSSFVHDLQLNAGLNASTGTKDRDNDNDGDRDDNRATTTVALRNGSAFAAGTVGSVSGTSFTLNAVSARGASTGTVSVTTNGSTTFKGGATSTASLSSGERVLVIGTSSTSSPNTISASFVILLQNIGNFFTRLFIR